MFLGMYAGNYRHTSLYKCLHNQHYNVESNNHCIPLAPFLQLGQESVNSLMLLLR